MCVNAEKEVLASVRLCEGVTKRRRECAPARLALPVFQPPPILFVFLYFLFVLNSFLHLPLPPSSDLHASPPVAAGAEEAKSQHAAAASATERECQAQAVSMETSSPSCKKASHTPAHSPPPPPPPSPPPLPPPASLLTPVSEVVAKDTGSATSGAAVVVGGLEDDKDRIVVEIMQMYSRQQEKLNSTLHKQLQLELVSWWLERIKTKINEPKIN